MSRWILPTVLLISLAGCASRPSAVEPAPTAEEPLGLQMVRTEAQFRNYPFFALLSFERESDPVFAKADGPSGELDSSRAHTGTHSLRLAAGTRGVTIKLASLHSGRDWPGRWTLIGAYFYSTQAQRMTAAFEVNGRAITAYTVEIPGGQWTPVVLDVAAASSTLDSAVIGSLRFAFGNGLAAPIWCDDVVEIDNRATLVEGRPDGWSIEEKGFQYSITRPGIFAIVLKTPEASDQGWKVEEANEVRAVFSSRGRSKSMILYNDGRQYVDGKLNFVVGEKFGKEQLAQQEAAPAQITVANDTGQVIRTSPGDANNDGYNETTGTYRIAAAGPRMELQIAPRTPRLASPVLEISDLPAGQVLVTMEGRLVENVARLQDGRVLAQLPGALTRPTSINIKVGGSGNAR